MSSSSFWWWSGLISLVLLISQAWNYQQMWFVTPVLSLIIWKLIRVKTKKKKKSYWKELGFPEIGTETFGSWWTTILNPVLIHETDGIIYSYMKHNSLGLVGYMEYFKPSLLIADLELAKQILVKDFDYFTDRRDYGILKKSDSLIFKILFLTDGETWRELRRKISPTFTSSKIRKMFQLIDKSSWKLIEYLSSSSSNNLEHPIDFIDVFGRCAIDIIANVAFGVDSKAFASECRKSIFHEQGMKLQVEVNPKLLIKFVVMSLAPKLASALGLSLTNEEPTTFFKQIVLANIKERENCRDEKRRHDDFLQLMLDARMEQRNETNSKVVVELTDDLIAAQCILFIFAGSDTLQSTLLFTAYELASNATVQEKLFNEIDSCLNAGDGTLTYELVNQLKYLDAIIHETLRKYPPVTRLQRRATKDYKIPNTNLIIPKGTNIGLPTYSFHHDEQYFPSPELFSPERFLHTPTTTTHHQKDSSYSFQPFGHGPRNCLGMRYALIGTKMVIAQLVHKFELLISKETLIPMRFAKSTFLKPESMLLTLRVRN